MATSTYDPALHLLSFAGQLISAFGKDTFIKATRAEDSFTTQVGVSGEGVRSKNNNRSGTVEITVMAQSQDCDVLSAILAADEASGAGVATFFMKQLNGTSVLHAANAWLMRQPDMERAKEAGEVTFTIATDNLEMFNGGLL